jgi:hypothetical protein
MGKEPALNPDKTSLLAKRQIFVFPVVNMLSVPTRKIGQLHFPSHIDLPAGSDHDWKKQNRVLHQSYIKKGLTGSKARI